MNPDQQNSERVRGFPVEIDVEEGEHDAGENIFDDNDSGDDPDGEDSDDPPQRNIPELQGNLLFQHESIGHWPYDRGCDACV